MDTVTKTLKRNILSKVLDRCRSPFGDGGSQRPERKSQLAPEGCFSVYVGAERQRFFVRTELASHPSFRMLLEDAESIYGHNSQGPLVLPCDVGLFCRVLAVMDGDDDDFITNGCCGVAEVACSPFRGRSRGGGSFGSFVPIRQCPMLEMNQFLLHANCM